MKAEELKALMEMCKNAPYCMISVGFEGVRILIHDKKMFDEITDELEKETEVYEDTTFTSCTIDGVLYQKADRNEAEYEL